MNAINPLQLAAAEAKRYEIPYPVVICRDAGVIRDFEITKLPSLIIIDQQGVIQESKLFLPADKIKVVIDKLLAQPPTAGQ